MVYVDSFNAPFGRMVMSHMMADTTAELLDMADRIGVARKWIQNPGTVYEHFDICLSKKKQAIRLGAKDATFREIADIINSRKLAGMDRGDDEPLPSYCFTMLTYVVFADGAPSPERTEYFQFSRNASTFTERQRVILEYLEEIAREDHPGKMVLVQPVKATYPERDEIPRGTPILQMSA